MESPSFLIILGNYTSNVLVMVNLYAYVFEFNFFHDSYLRTLVKIQLKKFTIGFTIKNWSTIVNQNC
jgi:hypothetical protein